MLENNIVDYMIRECKANYKLEDINETIIEKSSKLFKITKEFNLIDDELQKAKALLFNKNIEQRYQTKIC